MTRSLIVAVLIAVAGAAASAQSPADRNRARTQNRLGWDYMRSEQFENAVKAFQAAVEIDPAFEMPWYGLGRAHLALKQFVSATSALTRCRLYVSRPGASSHAQEAQRFRRIGSRIDEMIRRCNRARKRCSGRISCGSCRTAPADRGIHHARQQRTIETNVPAWVSLSLGSAYFRSGKLTDAEREFKAAVDADGRSGEALNNLAVVYPETERFALALSTIEAAKRTGFKVNPELEKVIRDKAR